MICPLNNQWYFTKQYYEELAADPGADLSGLEEVRLPHTTCRLPRNYCNEEDYQMVSGYVRELWLDEELEGRHISLKFEGAAHEATVFCNGQEICTHKCGYTAFEADITPAVVFGGKNRITVRLDSRENLNIPPFGNVIDYMTFGGIYRPVWLLVRDESHFTSVFVRGDMDGHMEISMEGVHTKDCQIRGRILDRSKKTVLDIWEQPFGDISKNMDAPRLWSIGRPYLYTLCLELIKEGQVVDTFETRFGFRTVSFTEQGFFLNGKRCRIRGLNRHQSWPYMGYGVPDRAQRLDADILKRKLGCNAVRTSHYPQSQAFIDRCDEIGLLVFTEIPGWQHIGDEDWKNQVYDNVREMVLQYRNHPSIFMWGVRINESRDDDDMYEKTNAIAHSLDPTRPTGGVRCIKNSHLLEDVYTYNDFIHNGANAGCQPKKAVTDTKKGYIITEYCGHMFPTKPFDNEAHRTQHALRHARVLSDAGCRREIAGSFGWCMFDYNTHKDFGSGDRVCYHGVLDMFRNPKLAAAVYASQQNRFPVLEVSSSMDLGEHPAGILGAVTVFTNGDYVRLYKNDEYIGSYTPDKSYPGMKHPPVIIRDRIGCLLEKKEGMDAKTAKILKECFAAMICYGENALPKAILAKMAWLSAVKHISRQQRAELFGKYIGGWGEKQTGWRFEAVRDGKVIAVRELWPFSAMILDVHADTYTLTDGPTWDMATVSISARDSWGNVLHYCQNGISLRTEGCIELCGPSVTSLSGGFGGCYVRTTGQAGRGRLFIRMEDMDEKMLEFNVEKALDVTDASMCHGIR